jgi:hypothetical protein
MSDPTPRRHGLIWLIFFLPGTVILWWQYYFPKHGDVWASARMDHPGMQLLYSLAFWAAVALLLLIFIVSGASGH